MSKNKSPNALGLCDMTGNVMEWCEGYLEKYENIHQVNPIGAPCHLEDKHVLRREAWCFAAKHCRLTNRSGELPNSCSYAFDFRIAMKK
jgi:formylglycine-generating enzyme required for sulfatase activity